MLHSNYLNSIKFSKIILPLLIITLLSSCATLNNTEDVNEDTTKSSKEINKLGLKEPEMSDGTQTYISRRKDIVDPMANIVLPLELIKSYEQVNQANELAQGVSLLQQLQVKYPQFSGPSYRLARVYQEQNKFDEAVNLAIQAIKINPKNYYVHNLLGVLYRETGEFELSKNAYNEAINVYFNHPASHLNLAILADIYLYDLSLALIHYETYMGLVEQNDEKVAEWIVNLKRRISRESEQ